MTGCSLSAIRDNLRVAGAAHPSSVAPASVLVKIEGAIVRAHDKMIEAFRERTTKDKIEIYGGFETLPIKLAEGALAQSKHSIG